VKFFIFNILCFVFTFKTIAAEKFIESTICFEDRRDGVAIYTDNDANDLCVSCKTIYDNNWPLQGGGNGVGAITILCTPMSIGAADNVELILHPDLPSSGDTAYSLHYEDNFQEISPGDTIYNRSQLFTCGGNFINVGAGLNCASKPRAVTLEEGHGLSDDFSLAEVFALKNITQGNDIITKDIAGSNVWVFPGAAAPVNEFQGTWYDAYNVSSVDSNCNPAGNSMASCDLNAVATYLATVDKSTLDAQKVNKTPPTALNFNITQTSGVTGAAASGGAPIFSGPGWDISTTTVSISNYFSENRSDGNGGNFSNFNLLKRRPICKLIDCSGGSTSSPGSGGASFTPSSGCSAPGNAPCDYSFCGCHTTSTGCATGDPNGDNTCYWDGSSCKGADNLLTQSACESAGFYWNYETSIGGYQCVGGNGGAHQCNTPLNDCTYMGKMDNSGDACNSTHRFHGNISISASHIGAPGTSTIKFYSNPSYGSAPSGEIPKYGACASSGQCQGSLVCDTATSARKCDVLQIDY